MALTLHYHPLSSFCHKVLIALYESGTPFTGSVVNLGDKAASAAFFGLWPIGKIPVLRDEAARRTIPETSIIIEYLEQRYPGPRPLLPRDESLRLDTRLWDRIFDLYVELPMQEIVGDRMRPEGEKNARGVAAARASLAKTYAMLDERMAGRSRVVGDAFSMADCAAAPALFYAGIVAPFADYPNVAAYFDRLTRRPSVARVLAEARPYFDLFPFKEDSRSAS